MPAEAAKPVMLAGCSQAVGGGTLCPGFRPGLVCVAPLGLDAMLLQEITLCGLDT
jgi:hypothetical protein